MLVLKDSAAHEEQSGLNFMELPNVSIAEGHNLVVSLVANFITNPALLDVTWCGAHITPFAVHTVQDVGLHAWYRQPRIGAGVSCVTVEAVGEPMPNSVVLTAYEETPEP